MNALRFMAVSFFVLVMAISVRAEEKKADNAKLIVGTWEVVKSDKGTLSPGDVIEFAKDGKLKALVKVDGKDMTLEATYTVAGDKLIGSRKVDGEEKKQAHTIKKLTATELTILDDKENKTIEFKRKK